MSEKTMGQRIKPSLWLVVILLGALVLYLLMIPAAPELEWGDSGTYIAMSQSLLAGKGLSLTYLPTDPAYSIVPVGYPLALAPLTYFFPHWFLPLRLLSVFMTLVTVVLVYLYARPQVPLWIALAAAALFATNVLIVKSAAQAMSEAIFLCSTMLLFLLADRFVRLDRVRWYDVLLLALAVALPTTIRYLGLPISAAVVLYLLWRRRGRTALTVGGLSVIFTLMLNIGIGGTAVATYFVTTVGKLLALLFPQGTIAGSAVGDATATVGSGGSTLDWIASNLWYMFSVSISGTFVPLFHGPRLQAWFAAAGLGFVPPLVQIAIVLALVVGFVMQVRKAVRVAEYAILAYAVTLILVPADWATLASAFRYWLPLTVVGYQYLLTVVDTAAATISSHWAPADRRVVRMAPTVLIAVGLLALNVGRDVQESLLNPIIDRVPDIFQAKSWVVANTSADATILVANNTPALYGLYFQREVIPTPGGAFEDSLLYAGIASYQEDPSSIATLLEIIEEYQVEYITIAPVRSPDIPLQWSSYVQNTLLPLVEAQPNQFPLVWKSADGFTRVFDVREGD